MNAKAMKLLGQLRENSREKLTIISRKTRIPISTLFDTLKDLQGKVITKSTVLVDFSELGYHARAQILLKVDKDSKENLKKHLLCNERVNTVYKVNNGWDFMVETVHKNIKELDCFLEKLKEEYNVENQEIHYLIDEVKREGFVVGG